LSYASTRIRQQLRDLAALPAGSPVPSPCNNVCRMDGATGFCLGCLRTIEEVIAWRDLPDDGRRDVWRQLAMRAGVKEQA
jgi:predicted Fe-S protein YdhL (DUF1289 family)